MKRRACLAAVAGSLTVFFCLIATVNNVPAQGCEKSACHSGDKYDVRQQRCESGPDFFGYRSHYAPSCPTGYDLDRTRGVCVQRGECCEKRACKSGYTFRDGTCNSRPSALGYRTHYFPNCGEGWTLDAMNGVCRKRDCGTGGMLIQRIDPESVLPGDTVEIQGLLFGEHQGSKIVAINLGHFNQMTVVNWSPNLIRARVPAGLAPGNYRVLIYYDDTFAEASNSLEVTVRRP